jgi:hypothetical protein
MVCPRPADIRPNGALVPPPATTPRQTCGRPKPAKTTMSVLTSAGSVETAQIPCVLFHQAGTSRIDKKHPLVSLHHSLMRVAEDHNVHRLAKDAP